MAPLRHPVGRLVRTQSGHESWGRTSEGRRPLHCRGGGSRRRHLSPRREAKHHSYPCNILCQKSQLRYTKRRRPAPTSMKCIRQPPTFLISAITQTTTRRTMMPPTARKSSGSNIRTPRSSGQRHLLPDQRTRPSRSPPRKRWRIFWNARG